MGTDYLLCLQNWPSLQVRSEGTCAYRHADSTCLRSSLASDPCVCASRQRDHYLCGSSLLLRRSIREVPSPASHFAECRPDHQFSMCVVSLLSNRVLSLAKLKQPKRSIQLILSIDFALLWWQNELYALKVVGFTVAMIITICILDRSFLAHKRRYSHLFELPTVQEYR